jgi:hypothetical protein
MLLDVARRADEPDLRRLLRENPMNGEVQISLEREPDFFLAAAVGADSYRVVVVREEASMRVRVMGQCSIMKAYVNGEATWVGYTHQLRADRAFRGYGRGIVRGHQKLRELHAGDGPSLYFSVIVADNRAARRFVEAQLKGMPTYRALEPFVTLALPLRRAHPARPSGITVERGGAETLDEIVDCLQRNAKRYQLAPLWTREDLLSAGRTRGLAPNDFYLARRDGRTVGCLALWDQRAFKQAIVRGYSPRLARLRPLVNLASPWLRTPRLPGPGEQLESAFVSHIAVDGDNSEVLLDLLAGVYCDASARNLEYLLVGVAQRNPFLEVIRENYPCREYVSLIYQVGWDAHAAATGRLDGRCPHLEAAIL